MAETTTGHKRKTRDDTAAPASKRHKPDIDTLVKAPRRWTKSQDARHISIQATSDEANVPSHINVASFVASREFEIKALEDALSRSKDANMRRAFQLLPRSLRRRAGSHNVKRVPKRLRARAQRDMQLDNGANNASKPRQMRGVKRLNVEESKRAYGQKLKAKREKKEKRLDAGNGVAKIILNQESEGNAETAGKANVTKPHAASSNETKKAPLPRGKFSKRQKDKAWLPTHVWHAKRCKMTDPQNPLWRISIPMTPNDKCFRASLKASGDRGTILWETSYMSTIGLEGWPEAILDLLGQFGVKLSGSRGEKWIHGSRSWSGWLHHNAGSFPMIGPARILWATPEARSIDEYAMEVSRGSRTKAARLARKKLRRKLFIRLHPSTFLEFWESLLPVAKAQKPPVSLEDLRYEIGSIELMGPSGMYALQCLLDPARTHSLADAAPESTQQLASTIAERWRALSGVNNAALLPAGSVMTFNASDPRIRTSEVKTQETNQSIRDHAKTLQILSSWPYDESDQPELFSRKRREAVSSQMVPQKVINRRRQKLEAGSVMTELPTDPRIPIIVVAHQQAELCDESSDRLSSSPEGSFTLLLPRSAVLHFWHSLMHQPLNDGVGPPRYGGLDEYRQIHHSRNTPWFPGDFPGTEAGRCWEERMAAERRAAWERKPKGRRIEFESMVIGIRKGEIGEGWRCDWYRLLHGPQRSSLLVSESTEVAHDEDRESRDAADAQIQSDGDVAMESIPPGQQYMASEHSDIGNPAEVPLKAPIEAPVLSQLTASQAAQYLNLPLRARQTRDAAASPEAMIVDTLPRPTDSSDHGSASDHLLPPISNPLPPSGAVATIRLIPVSRGTISPAARIYRLPTDAKSLELWTSYAAAALLPKSLRRQPSSIHTARREAGMSETLPSFMAAVQQVGDLGYPDCPGEEDLVGFATSGEKGIGEKGAGFGGVVLRRIIEGRKGMKEIRLVTGKAIDLKKLILWRNAGDGFARLAWWDIAR